MTTRRQALALAALPGLALVPGCRGDRRARVLGDFVRVWLPPLYARLKTASAALATATAALAAAPDAAKLAEAQRRWRVAAVVWRTAYAFRHGPIMERRAFYRAAYWPTQPARIEALARDTSPLEAASIEELGATQKGLFALEQLIFDRAGAGAVLAALVAPAAARRRRLCELLAADIARLAAEVDQALAARGPGLIEAMARNQQVAMSELVHGLVLTVEDVVIQRLGAVIGAYDHRTLARNPVEGHASASSRDLALAVLDGAIAVYGAGDAGLSALVAAAAPAIDRSTREAFAAGRHAVVALPEALDLAVTQDRAAVAAATEAVRAAERAIKVGVASALGVTITFTAGDGD